MHEKMLGPGEVLKKGGGLPHTQVSDLNEQVYTNRFHEDQVIIPPAFMPTGI